MVGKGAMNYDHPQALGAIGVTGTPGANIVAREADLVIVLGSRLSDFTTASKTAFQNPEVRFINVNVAGFDAAKHAALPLVADVRVTLEELDALTQGYAVAPEYRSRVERFGREWDAEVEHIYHPHEGGGQDGAANGTISQSEVIGAVNSFARPQDVVVCAAGSLPGDLHKLWRTRDPKGYHLEYGYSCMGYEIAGGLGVKMAAPERDVYVMVGDGSYLMMAQEIVTAVQEDCKLIIVLLDNHGFSSIGGLSESVGSAGFGTYYRFRDPTSGLLDGPVLPVDLAANARSLGADVIEARDLPALRSALETARDNKRTTVIAVEVDREQRVGGYESWWDVPIAEVSEVEAVRQARAEYEVARKRERAFVQQPG